MTKKIIFATIFNLLIYSSIVAVPPNLNTFFVNEGLVGSITIYDLKNDKWIYSDEKDTETKLLPASSFKILNSLIALEEKVIKINEVLKWDGKNKMFRGKVVASWNSDTDIETAFKNSTIWFYVELSKKVGRKTYKKYLKKVNYGNLKLDEKGFDFWNYGDFAVSPKDQINFLVKLYKNELPFSKENMEYVKKIMIQENNDNYILRGKTGWGIRKEQEIGWYIGYVEAKSNVYFFATRIISDTKGIPSTFSSSRKTITMSVLKEFNFIK
jgi:beta-lactamase class D